MFIRSVALCSLVDTYDISPESADPIFESYTLNIDATGFSEMSADIY